MITHPCSNFTVLLQFAVDLFCVPEIFPYLPGTLQWHIPFHGRTCTHRKVARIWPHDLGTQITKEIFHMSFMLVSTTNVWKVATNILTSTLHLCKDFAINLGIGYPWVWSTGSAFWNKLGWLSLNNGHQIYYSACAHCETLPFYEYRLAWYPHNI